MNDGAACTAIAQGIGAGGLSAAALARRERGATPEPPMPPIDDLDGVGRWRAAIHAAWGEHDDPEVPHRPTCIAGVPCLEAGVSNATTVVYVHGGAHVLGSPGVAVPITARLADRCRVVSVDYRLAPEHPFPAALQDVVGVCVEMGARGQFALAGESAGGGLALAAAVALRDEGRRVPFALALLSPHLSHERVVAAEDVRRRDAYLAGMDPADATASPLHAALDGLPPVLVQVAADEAVFGQAVALARRARVSGVEVTLDVWADVWHAWHYHRMPEADRAIAEVASFITARSPVPTPSPSASVITPRSTP